MFVSSSLARIASKSMSALLPTTGDLFSPLEGEEVVGGLAFVTVDLRLNIEVASGPEIKAEKRDGVE